MHLLQLTDYRARRRVPGQTPDPRAWMGGDLPPFPQVGCRSRGAIEPVGQAAPRTSEARQGAAPRQAPRGRGIRAPSLQIPPCVLRRPVAPGRLQRTRPAPPAAPAASGRETGRKHPALCQPLRWSLRSRAPGSRIPSPGDSPAGSPGPIAALTRSLPAIPPVPLPHAAATARKLLTAPGRAGQGRRAQRELRAPAGGGAAVSMGAAGPGAGRSPQRSLKCSGFAG